MKKKDYTIKSLLRTKREYALVNEKGEVREIYKNYNLALGMRVKMEKKWFEKLKMIKI